MAALLEKIRDGDNPAAAEQEILRITGLLEDELNQRSAEVAAANKELENFSYSVSHDLRAPLSTIDGFSRLLEGAVAKGNAERSTHYLQRIRLGVANINELVAALLAVSRLLRAPMTPQAVDFGALAAEAFAALQQTEPERVVQIDIQPGLAVHGDPALLRQLVDHLAGNAWKFSSKKTARRWLSAAGWNRPARRFIFSATTARVLTWRTLKSCSAFFSACMCHPTFRALVPA